MIKNNFGLQNCTPHKKAFSIAEAIVTLLIISIALAAAAPIMSRQAKASLEAQNNGGVPGGAIMFFEDKCPAGWINLSSDSRYAGRYFRVAGEYDVCDKDGENADGTCIKKERTVKAGDNSAGLLKSESMRRITGTFPGNDANVNYFNRINNYWKTAEDAGLSPETIYVKALNRMGVLTGVFNFMETVEASEKDGPFEIPNWRTAKYGFINSSPADLYNAYNRDSDYIYYIDPELFSNTNASSSSNAIWFITKFDTKRSVHTDIETRPKTIVLLACKKR